MVEFMETITRRATVRGGRVTVEVPVAEGLDVNVIILPRRSQENVEAMLAEADRLRAVSTARAPDAETLEDWIQAGRL